MVSVIGKSRVATLHLKRNDLAILRQNFSTRISKRRWIDEYPARDPDMSIKFNGYKNYFSCWCVSGFLVLINHPWGIFTVNYSSTLFAWNPSPSKRVVIVNFFSLNYFQNWFPIYFVAPTKWTKLRRKF